MVSKDARDVGYGLLGIGFFFVLLGVLLFVTLFFGLCLGMVPIACGAPLEKLGPAYFWLGMIASFGGSIWGAIKATTWLAERRKRRDATTPAEPPPPPAP